MLYRRRSSLAVLSMLVVLLAFPSHAAESPLSFAGVAGATIPTADQAAVADLLSKWVAAQNAGDFAAYSALYAATFEGVRRSGDRQRIMRMSDWLKDRERMFKKPMTVGIGAVHLTGRESDVQVDCVQTWSSGSFTDFGPKRFLLAKDGAAFRIRREDMLMSLPVKEGEAAKVPAKAASAFAVIAGVFPSAEAAATALKSYTDGDLPSHPGYPKSVPASQVGIALTGHALLVAVPKNQQVAALLAEFITQLGAPAFLWRTDAAAEDLYLARVAPHRLDLSDVPALKKLLGGKKPALRWEVSQYCNGCGNLDRQGRSVAAKDGSVLVPYTIDPRKEKKQATLSPDFPKDMDPYRSEWQDCGYTFAWNKDPAPYFEVGKEAIAFFKPGTLRLFVNECGD